MSKFILLISGTDKWSELSPAQMEDAVGKYQAFAKKLREEGKLIDADGLQSKRTVLQGGASGTTVSDGPFAETKEVIGGYYVYNANDLAEAVEIGKSCPGLQYGATCEVRQVMDYS